ncbi:unnamed protein product [Chrysodeixis includens]|uniref:Uncharacterized protein n=1 Tax=Chrysodeixis includens TaxID=689277 RepID=A0A9P0BHN5_CHRIL|nr:unnamed protein product [Chrysodeixis includens]
MSLKSFISAIILYLCFDFAHQQESYENEIVKRVTPVDKDWDFLIFTQNWPGSVCKVWTHKKPHHHCVYPNQKDSWTVHGIWPTKAGTKGPFNCNATWLFDPEEVRPIETELEQAWTNVEKETELYNLWAHEWNKHGTCAAMIEPLNGQLKYFSKGIEFLKQYHMTDILNAASIMPSDVKETNAEDINNAVVSKLGIRPVIECIFEDGVQYLLELRICFGKQLNLIECAGEKEVNGLLTNCNVSKGIMYPTQMAPPKRYLVQLHKFVNWLQWFTL